MLDMTEKDLRKLSRTELLDMLIAETKRSTELEQALITAQRRLKDRHLKMTNAGSMAEAAIRINGVMEAADAAAAQYLENLKAMSENSEAISRRMIEETRAKCDSMVTKAREESQKYWNDVYTRLRNFCADQQELQDMLGRMVMPKDLGDEE